MSWFKKLTGGGDGKKPDGKAARQFDRYKGQGEKIAIGVDDMGRGPTYNLLDVSLGGFAVNGYEGRLRGGQYVEFNFIGELEGQPAEIMGFANVVKVKGDMLCAQFKGPPRLKGFFENYFRNVEMKDIEETPS